MKHTPTMSYLITEKVMRYCTENGFTCTNQRLLVAAKLQELGRYTDAVELWLLLKEDGHAISIDCVYRGLNLLVSADLVSTSGQEGKQRAFRFLRDLAR